MLLRRLRKASMVIEAQTAPADYNANVMRYLHAPEPLRASQNSCRQETETHTRNDVVMALAQEAEAQGVSQPHIASSQNWLRMVTTAD